MVYFMLKNNVVIKVIIINVLLILAVSNKYCTKNIQYTTYMIYLLSSLLTTDFIYLVIII